jgi:hypothetical protein
MDNGASVKSAAAALAIPEKLVNAASIRRNTDQRFLENNINPLLIEKLPESVKRRLSQISTDEGFTAAVDLAHRASMSSTEAWDFVTEINELKSSAKQVAYVHERAGDLMERIGSTGGGVLNRKPVGPKARLNMAASTIPSLPENPAGTPRVQAHVNRTCRESRETAGNIGYAARALYAEHPRVHDVVLVELAVGAERAAPGAA